MNNNKLRKFITLPAALTILSSSAAAQNPVINNDLTIAASKVDIAGSYLELNKHDGDISFFTPYLQLIAEVAQSNNADFPKEFDAVKLVSSIGLDKLKATAVSNTELSDIWLNQIYIQTDPSVGIFSLFGGQAKEFAVTKMSPIGTDIALELSLDLSQLPTIARNLATSIGKNAELEKELAKKVPEIDMTIENFLKKSTTKLSLAIDLDPNSKLDIEGQQFDRPRLVGRIDGLTWLWNIIGDDLIKEAALPLGKTEKDGVITYAVPVEMTEMLKGYTPKIIVDKNKDQIWLVTSSEFLAKATTPGKQLADDPTFTATWEGLPTNGNSMAYISKDLLNTLEGLYAKAQKEGLLEDEKFKTAKPLIDKIINDLTKSKNGFAFSIANDGSGIHLANKTPFPAKYLKYLQAIAPILAKKHEVKFNDGMDEGFDSVH